MMIQQINTITELHESLGFQPPKHPLISIIRTKDLPDMSDQDKIKFSADLFMLSLKDGVECSLGYGRNTYDFTNGTMIFSKPKQVFTSTGYAANKKSKGWMLFFHPDLIRKSEFGKNISGYTFFDYEVNEALHLSDDERNTLTDLVQKIQTEINQNIDKHSQKLMISSLELILDYCNRFYDRQFYVRTNLNKDLVSEFEQLLKDYFNSEQPTLIGLPSVKYCGEQLHLSPNYLSDLLKKETGRSAKDHINDFVINKAKNRLLGSAESISQIAYGLGFEYPQHFSKVFKKQTGFSPAKYRSLN